MKKLLEFMKNDCDHSKHGFKSSQIIKIPPCSYLGNNFVLCYLTYFLYSLKGNILLEVNINTFSSLRVICNKIYNSHR